MPTGGDTEPEGSSEAESCEADIKTAHAKGVSLSREERFLKGKKEARLREVYARDHL